MKRLLAALFVALVVALVGAIGVASADPPHNFTTGGGKVVVTLIPDITRMEKFAFNAHAIGSTTGARNGHYVYEQTQTFPDVPQTVRLELKGRVDCVRVVGNGASFVGRIEKSKTTPNLVGSFANFDVVDNDQPPGNGADPDQFLFAGISSISNCGLPLAGNPLTSGNIVVNNAQ
jgi:hypothetical protein